MARSLAEENVPLGAIDAARRAGLDLASARESNPGIDDDAVLTMSLSEGRVLVTFDKDFGEMAFRRGLRSHPGVVLPRPRLRSPVDVARFVAMVLS